MNDDDRRALFIHQAEVQGLIYPVPKKGQRWHIFDLNSGQLAGRPERSQVEQLVNLASSCARSPDYGVHIALRELVADRRELERFVNGGSKMLCWHRPYHVGKDPQRWVSLAAWLADECQVGESARCNVK